MNRKTTWEHILRKPQMGPLTPHLQHTVGALNARNETIDSLLIALLVMGMSTQPLCSVI